MALKEFETLPSGKVRCCNNKSCRTNVYPATYVTAADDGIFTIVVVYRRHSNNERISPILNSVPEALAWFHEREHPFGVGLLAEVEDE